MVIVKYGKYVQTFEDAAAAADFASTRPGAVTKRYVPFEYQAYAVLLTLLFIGGALLTGTGAVG